MAATEEHKIKKIVEFLSFFENQDPDALFTNHPANKQEDGSIEMGFTSYHSKVNEFFRTIYDLEWIDRDYNDKGIGYEQIENDQWIASASLDDVKTSFTFINRAEYWSTGSLAEILEKEIMTKLLRRLNTLFSELMNQKGSHG